MDEGYAVRKACWFAAAQNLVGLTICSDSKSVITLASSDLEPLWEISEIIEDIRSLAVELHLMFVFIPRDLNVVAHWVVKSASKSFLPAN